MIEYTEDSTIIITDRTEDYIEYKNIDGKKWRVYGKCIACGLCENKPSQIPSTVVEKIERVSQDGTEYIQTRTLIWSAEPGVPGACIEKEFETRKDIPITPQLKNNIPACTLTGVWIDGD